MLRGSHRSCKDDSGNFSGSAARLAAFTFMEKWSSGSVGITAHTLHTCEGLWEAFVLNVNVDMCVCGEGRKEGRKEGEWLCRAKLLSNSIFHALNFQR